jgi:hypothetical protein
MKKIALLLVLIVVFSISSFADGDIPTPKSCPPDQACSASATKPATPASSVLTAVLENVWRLLL